MSIVSIDPNPPLPTHNPQHPTPKQPKKEDKKLIKSKIWRVECHCQKANLQKELSCPWIEYKDGTIDGFCCEIPFKRFVDGNTIYICVVNKPDYLIAEDFTIVLRWEIWFCGLGWIQLQTFSYTLSQHIQSWIWLHMNVRYKLTLFINFRAINSRPV